MSYRVAVIQNENELLRYSYADARHLLTRAGYNWDYYTAENIGDLALRLSLYDAMIITTNSCNDPAISTWLSTQAHLVNEFLESGSRGLLVLFQMALSDKRGEGKPFPFLSEFYAVKGQYRFGDNEQAGQGHLGLVNRGRPHPVLFLPNRIDGPTLDEECRHNSNAPGLYWGYLDGFSEQAYQVLVEDTDTDPPRALFLVSHPVAGPRVVVSSLVIDWQRLDHLWENAVRYVVEGPAPIAIIKRCDRRTFSLDFLQYALREHRIPFSLLDLTSLENWNDNEGQFSGVVLDPAWSQGAVSAFLRRTTNPGLQKLHFFLEFGNDRSAACTVPSRSNYEHLVQSAISWLQTRWNNDLWDQSFWVTHDVLDLFRSARVPLDPYREAVLSGISPRIQPNGSYDDVFGATCATLQIYKWLDFDGSDEFSRAIQFIRENLTTQTLYNAATALDLLWSVASDVLDCAIITRTLEQIRDTAALWNEGLETLRYMRTLIAFGDYESASQNVEKLRPAAAGGEAWLSVFGAAETVELLLDLYDHVQSSRDPIEEMLFSGIEYLISHHDASTGSWRESTAATARAAKALHLFSTRSPAAIGEAIRSIVEGRNQDLFLRSTELLRERVVELGASAVQAESQVVQMVDRISRLEVSIRRFQTSTILAVVTGYVGVLSLIAVGLGWAGVLNGLIHWLSTWQQVAYPIVFGLVLAPIVTTIRLLDGYHRQPQWLSFLRERVRIGERFVIPAAKKD